MLSTLFGYLGLFGFVMAAQLPSVSSSTPNMALPTLSTSTISSVVQHVPTKDNPYVHNTDLLHDSFFIMVGCVLAFVGIVVVATMILLQCILKRRLDREHNSKQNILPMTMAGKEWFDDRSSWGDGSTDRSYTSDMTDQVYVPHGKKKLMEKPSCQYVTEQEKHNRDSLFVSPLVELVAKQQYQQKLMQKREQLRLQIPPLPADANGLDDSFTFESPETLREVFSPIKPISSRKANRLSLLTIRNAETLKGGEVARPPSACLEDILNMAGNTMG